MPAVTTILSSSILLLPQNMGVAKEDLQILTPLSTSKHVYLSYAAAN